MSTKVGGGGRRREKQKSMFPGRHFGSCLHLQSVCFSCCRAIWLSEELTALNAQPLLAAGSCSPPSIKGCVKLCRRCTYKGKEFLLLIFTRFDKSTAVKEGGGL